MSPFSSRLLCCSLAIVIGPATADPAHAQVLEKAPARAATSQTRALPAASAPAGTQASVAPPDAPAEQGDTAAGETPAREYVRIKKKDKLAYELQTSVIRFEDSSKFPDTTVDLIGAIHLGEASYYRTLNDSFSQYDVLLFEAVMPESAVKNGFRPGAAKGTGRSLSDEEQWDEAKIGLQAISGLQLAMKDALGLEFQLAGIDYNAANFVHADMTQEEFEASMARKGESFSEMLVREMGRAAVDQQGRNPIAQQLDMMLSLMSSDRTYRVRRIAAVELARANEGDAFAGSDGTSTIITERNIKALKVLRRELASGRKKIGIFYGAGHFPDMEKRLESEFGFSRGDEKWITAWKLRKPESK